MIFDLEQFTRSVRFIADVNEETLELVRLYLPIANGTVPTNPDLMGVIEEFARGSLAVEIVPVKVLASGAPNAADLAWCEQFIRLARFVQEHGGFPSQTESDDGGDPHLGRWAGKIVARRPTGARAALLDLAVPGWDNRRDAQWWQQLHRYEEFVQEHARVPGDRKGEKPLNTWLHEQRAAWYEHRMLDWREEALADRLPNWLGDGRKPKNLARVAPSKSSDHAAPPPVERDFLSEEREVAAEVRCLISADGDAEWMSLMGQLVDVIESHELPRFDFPEERSLWSLWVHEGLLSVYRPGELPRPRRAAWELVRRLEHWSMAGVGHIINGGDSHAAGECECIARGWDFRFKLAQLRKTDGGDVLVDGWAEWAHSRGNQTTRTVFARQYLRWLSAPTVCCRSDITGHRTGLRMRIFLGGVTLTTRSTLSTRM